MTREPLTPERLRAAFHAHADGVEPDEDLALTTIRRRGHAARVRRRAVLGGAATAVVLVFAALVIPRLGEDPSQVETVNQDEEQTTTTERPTDTTTTAPTEAADLTAALWPPPGGERFDTPEAAAESFVEDFVGLDDPRFGETQLEEPRRVQIAVLAQREDGSVFEGQIRSTLHLVQGGDDNWHVTLAQSDELSIDTENLDVGPTSATVSGHGNGFEGNLVVRVRTLTGDELAHGVDTVTQGTDPLPFEVSVTYARPQQQDGAIMLTNDGGFEAIADFTIVPVDFGTVPGEIRTITVEVYFVGADDVAQVVERDVEFPALLTGAMAELFEGPSQSEQGRGLRSALPAEGADLVTAGVAVVDIPTAVAAQVLPAEQAALVVEQLRRTAVQFDSVTTVEFRIGGSCDAFATWIGRPGECRYDRTGPVS